MKNKNILILGSTGFIGRSLTKKLLSKGHQITSPVRNPDKVKRNILSGDIGQINIIPFNVSNLYSIEADIKEADIIVNLLGILFEKPNRSFDTIHYHVPKVISDITNKYNKRFIHISSLGSTTETKSSYLYSKALGEHYIETNHNNYSIIKPSIVFGEEDNFLNQFGYMTKFLPFLPLYKIGNTKFQPIYLDDLTSFISKIIDSDDSNFLNKSIDAVGPNIYSFKEILEMIFEIVKKKKRFINIPDFFASLQGRLMGTFPNPPFTYDQFLSLSHDSISPGADKFIKVSLGRELSSMKLVASNYLKKFIDKV
jgi:NADH dehydrogenase